MPAGSPPTPPNKFASNGGDATAGFQVMVDPENRILRVQAWGLWSLELARGYRAAMFEGFERLRGRPWSVLSDRRRSVPQREDVQEVMGEVLRRATALGRVKAAVLVTAPTSQLQMRRLATEAKIIQKQFNNEAEALAWLRLPLHKF